MRGNQMRWITRQNANVARVACAWLSRRFDGRGLRAIAHGFAYLDGKQDQRKIEIETPMYALYAFFEREVATLHTY